MKKILATLLLFTFLIGGLFAYDTDWHYVGDSGEPAFEDDWQGSLRFMRGADGDVKIQGTANDTSNATSTIFILPLGYRPDVVIMNGVRCSTDNSIKAIVIYTNGLVEIIGTPTGSYSVNINFFIGPIFIGDGEQGPKGDIGNTGTSGIQGIQGIQGVAGEDGEDGATGAQGVKGDKGDDGEPADSDAVAKAWVNFDGSGTVVIHSSYNIASAVRTATGTWTVTFTNAMNDTDYAVIATVKYATATNAETCSIVSKTTSGFVIKSQKYSSGVYDSTGINIVVFGN